MTLSRDCAERVQQPDGDQYSLLPPRDVSEGASCQVFDIEPSIVPLPR